MIFFCRMIIWIALLIPRHLARFAFFQTCLTVLMCSLDASMLQRLIMQIGTDIEDFKCSWLVVKALERCSKEQTEILYVIILLFFFCSQKFRIILFFERERWFVLIS